MSRKRKGERGKGTIIIDLLVWRQRCCHCSPPLLHGRNGDGLFLPLSGKRKGGGGRFAILFFSVPIRHFFKKGKRKGLLQKNANGGVGFHAFSKTQGGMISLGGLSSSLSSKNGGFPQVPKTPSLFFVMGS